MKTRPSAVIQKPNLIGNESVFFTFRQSHTPQAKKTKIPVAKNSAMKPWNVDKSAWRSVMQKVFPESGCPAYISSTGVITWRDVIKLRFHEFVHNVLH